MTFKVRYVGPPGQVNDALGGALQPGQTYEVPGAEALEELLRHPSGWFAKESERRGTPTVAEDDGFETEREG